MLSGGSVMVRFIPISRRRVFSSAVKPRGSGSCPKAILKTINNVVRNFISSNLKRIRLKLTPNRKCHSEGIPALFSE